MLRVLLLAKLTPQSGNETTAERIRCHLMENNCTCELQSTTSFENVQEFREYLTKEKVQCVIGIHLWRAGRYLIDSSIPFSLVFGGTDLNEYYKESDKFIVMTKVVKQANSPVKMQVHVKRWAKLYGEDLTQIITEVNLVAFSSSMACKAKDLWPDIAPKIILQAQAVSTKPSDFSEKDLINRMMEFADSEDESFLENITQGSLILFLLIAGLRRVKDPTFLFKNISEWHKKDPRVYFVVIGAETDPEFSKKVKQSAKQFPGVLVISALSQCDLHAVIKYSTTAVVNSSSSEGMASSLLEAMDLETPVIARRNPGNESLIKHNENGLLFDTPEEFLSLAQHLVSSKEQRDRLRLGGRQFIFNNHSTTDEKKTYCAIVEKLTGNITHVGMNKGMNTSEIS